MTEPYSSREGSPQLNQTQSRQTDKKSCLFEDDINLINANLENSSQAIPTSHIGPEKTDVKGILPGIISDSQRSRLREIEPRSSKLSGLINKLSGQPATYQKKAKYQFGIILGESDEWVIKEAVGPMGKVAINVGLKKNIERSKVHSEVEILQRMKHPGIIGFIEWFESKDKYYIVTQLASGGELFGRIVSQVRFSENDALQTTRQVLEIVGYLHENNIVHRDLKPENFWYLTSETDSRLVLTGFGVAKTLDSTDKVLSGVAGSMGYAAPEIMLKEDYGKPVDMWSLGAITYCLLGGYSPFRNENIKDLIKECSNDRVVFHPTYWKDISSNAKDFITKLLRFHQGDRLSAKEALIHPWINQEQAKTNSLALDIAS